MFEQDSLTRSLPRHFGLILFSEMAISSYKRYSKYFGVVTSVNHLKQMPISKEISNFVANSWKNILNQYSYRSKHINCVFSLSAATRCNAEAVYTERNIYMCVCALPHNDLLVFHACHFKNVSTNIKDDWLSISKWGDQKQWITPHQQQQQRPQ